MLQILLQAARAVLAHCSLVREWRNSLVKLGSRVIRPLTKPDLCAASSEPDNMRSSRPQLKLTFLYQGMAFPELRKALRHQFLKRAEYSFQDGPLPDLAETAEPLEGRLNTESYVQIRRIVWGKLQREYYSITMWTEICIYLQNPSGSNWIDRNSAQKIVSKGYSRSGMKWNVTCDVLTRRLEKSECELVR